MINYSAEFKNIPVVILCGGKGVVLGGVNSERINKALIKIEGFPLFWWVMQTYVLHGASNFILALGYQGDQLRMDLKHAGAIQVNGWPNRYQLTIEHQTCYVTLVQCAFDANTAIRLLACKPALDTLDEYKNFAVAYSDTLSDIDLGSEIKFHLKTGLICTLASAKLPVRFRVLGIRPGEVLVRGFSARPMIETANINGGYYLFSRDIWELSQLLAASTGLENEPLEHLALAGQLAAYEHKGAWQPYDAERDLIELGVISKKLLVSP